MNAVEEKFKRIEELLTGKQQSMDANARRLTENVLTHMAVARECLDVGATESAVCALRFAGSYFGDLAEMVHRDPESVPAYADIKAALTELFAAAKEAVKNDPVYIEQSRRKAQSDGWGFVRNETLPLTMPLALRDPSQ